VSDGKAQYTVRKWITCPKCEGKGCSACWDGHRQVEISLDVALREMGITGQLDTQVSYIDKLNDEMLVMAREMLRMQEELDELKAVRRAAVMAGVYA
jgi:hypothetical protein